MESVEEWIVWEVRGYSILSPNIPLIPPLPLMWVFLPYPFSPPLFLIYAKGRSEPSAWRFVAVSGVFLEGSSAGSSDYLFSGFQPVFRCFRVQGEIKVGCFPSRFSPCRIFRFSSVSTRFSVSSCLLQVFACFRGLSYDPAGSSDLIFSPCQNSVKPSPLRPVDPGLCSSSLVEY